MIVIKDKKAWKEFLKDQPYNDYSCQPKSYPFVLELISISSGGCKLYDLLYKSELQSIIDKIDAK